ncbi:hypothetical protein B0H14DRAFT_2807775 [Mycena olivaceomarginata]|nr:hypothetical protein B0H14DRAFT_2807775 [Mycena olivaceomarginata]
MVPFSPLLLQLILFLLVSLSIASPAPRATNPAASLPTAPAGSKVVVVSATDPGIVWSPGWQTVPSTCSSDSIRTVSDYGWNYTTDYVATFNFRGTGIYANLQSGDAEFAITLDGEQSSFGYLTLPVPANCTYDWFATNLTDDDHLFMMTALGPSISTDSFWTLSLESLAIFQSDSDTSNPSSPTSTSPTITPDSNAISSDTPPARTSPSPSGTDSSSIPGSSPSGSAAKPGGRAVSTPDIIAIVTSIIGGVASVFAIIAGIYRVRKWREAKRRPPSQDFLLDPVRGHR